MLRPNIHGLYTPYKPINYNTTSCTSALTLHLPSRYFLFKILHPNNKITIIKSFFNMGRDLYVKVLKDQTIKYAYKTKQIMEHLDLQDSFSHG